MRAFVPSAVLRQGLKTRAHWRVPFPEVGLKTHGHKSYLAHPPYPPHPPHPPYFMPMFAAAKAHWSARSAISLSVGR
jgi:hypothetical protein